MESTFRASLVVGHQILETVLPGNRCSSFMNFPLESINIAISGLGGSCLGCGLVALGCGHLCSCDCVLRGVWARGGRCTASWCVCAGAGGSLGIFLGLCCWGAVGCGCGTFSLGLFAVHVDGGGGQLLHQALYSPVTVLLYLPHCAQLPHHSLPVLLQRQYLLPQLPHLSLCQCQLPAHLAELLFKELCVIVGSEVGQHQLL